MKYKTLLLLLLLLPFAFVLSGWSQKVVWGNPVPEKRKVIVMGNVSNNPSSTIVMKGKGVPGYPDSWLEFELEAIDAQCNSTLNVPLVPTYGKRTPNMRFYFDYNGKIYMFCSFADSKGNKRLLLVQNINRNTLQVDGPMTPIAELTYTNGFGEGGFDYRISRDSSHVLIVANSIVKRKEPEKFALYVFDKDMKLEWTREVRLPYAENMFVQGDLGVDNGGNVFMTGCRYTGEVRSRSSEEYQILVYSKSAPEATVYPVQIKDKFVNEWRIDLSSPKQIVCSGFYSEGSINSIAGTFYLRINRANKEIEKLSLHEFDLAFKTLYMSARDEAKTIRLTEQGNTVQLNDYKLHDLIPRADGGTILLAERYYVTTLSTGSAAGSGSYTTYYYHYNNIIVVSINPTGDIQWATKIPKFQVSTNDFGFYSSFATMVTDDKLYLIYNDHKANLQSGEAGVTRNFSIREKNGIVVLATIDDLGKLSRRELFPNTEIEAVTVPKLCKQVSKTQMLMYAKTAPGNQYGMVTF